MNDAPELQGQDARIWTSAKFQELVKRRRVFMWSLFLLTCLLFFGYTFVVAFVPTLLAVPAWPGAVTNIGIVAGAAVIIVSFILTGIYVYRANREFDRVIREIITETGDDEEGTV